MLPWGGYRAADDHTFDVISEEGRECTMLDVGFELLPPDSREPQVFPANNWRNRMGS